MYVLGIETSCDETSCAILKDYQVLSNITLSSLREHKKYGGVIPEIATRAHLVNIDKVVELARVKAKVSFTKIGLIAVTHQPGLIGSLVIGVNFSKALALSLGKPLIGIDHLKAHLFAPFLNYKHKIKFPFLGLVVSGGHTEIYQVEDFNKINLVGGTRDDACGEVFDKIGVSYGLGYPGGPVIDKMFDSRYKDDFKFKCGKIGLDLSFSGIKTALMYKKIELEKKKSFDGQVKKRLVSSFQYAVFEAIIGAVQEASKRLKIKRLVAGGGVLANSYLRQRLEQQTRYGYEVLLSPLAYSGDNAAVVAGLGFYLYNKYRITSKLSLKVRTN